MISTRRTLLSVLLTATTFCVAAAQQTNVFYPAFPVLAGRSHNIVSEICIDGKRGSTLDYVEVALDGKGCQERETDVYGHHFRNSFTHNIFRHKRPDEDVWRRTEIVVPSGFRH